MSAWNVLRTIQKDEKKRWVDLLFEVGPHNGEYVPYYPAEFPSRGRFTKDIKGGYLYVVYRSRVIGFGRIAKVMPHQGMTVGTQEQLVSPGWKIVLEGPCRRLTFDLPCRGFQGYRYTEPRLHELAPDKAFLKIRTLNLVPLK
jgi:hypothetical protein